MSNVTPFLAIPIIGQPIIQDFTVDVLLICDCPAHAAFVVSTKYAGTCPSCQKRIQVQGINAENGQLQFAFATSGPQKLD